VQRREVLGLLSLLGLQLSFPVFTWCRSRTQPEPELKTQPETPNRELDPIVYRVSERDGYWHGTSCRTSRLRVGDRYYDPRTRDEYHVVKALTRRADGSWGVSFVHAIYPRYSE
jgi:hypothetical protein